MPQAPARGDVWEVDLEPVRGAETGKKRPCLIIQNDVGNKYASTTIIAVITGAENVPKDCPVDIRVKAGVGGLRKESVIMCSQIRTVDKTRLMKRIGKIPPHAMEEVNKALKISLELD